MKKLSIKQRIQMLEDKEAIKDLTYQYAGYVNQGWNGIKINPDALRDIFTKGAVWESPIMNIRECGIDNIIKSLRTETKSVMFAMHNYSNPVIKIDCNTATGNWLFWVVSKIEKDKTNQVFMSQDIEYINTKKGWNINSVTLHFGNMIRNKIPAK